MRTGPTMLQVTGGELVTQVLAREGVRHLFTLCGGHILPIYDACLRDGIAVVDTRHEQAAAHAADAYARLTRRLGVAAVVPGPGVTDAVTGVANAFAARSPLLLIGGASPLALKGMGALQEMEQVALFRPITKGAWVVPDTRRIPEYLTTAIRTARSGRPGPVFVEIAVDLLMGSVDAADAPVPEVGPVALPAPPAAEVERVAALLAGAERPAVVAGSGVYWDGGAAALADFAEHAGVPVFTNGMGRGCLPSAHPCAFQLARGVALREADLVLVLGTPLDFRLGYGRPPTLAEAARLVMVDADASEFGRNRPVDVGIAADLRLTLEAFRLAVPAGSAQRTEAWRRRLREKEDAEQARQAVLAASDQIPISHYRLAAELAAVMDDDTCLIGDGGDVVTCASKLVPLSRPAQWLDPGPLGVLGVGPPFALAAKLLHPGWRVLLLSGDGAFGLNGMELETAVRFDLPLVCVVGNDGGWGMIRTIQESFYGRERLVGTSLPFTRYDRVVEALGGAGETIEDPTRLRPALERALASGRVSCLNVILDPGAYRREGGGSLAI
ncbi:MAG TPA: thiamine pyrophosphate-binding protein [Methylomirabilota bacterium]|nr:thiamine pyrophosphate-binding protein [Methylomirabilota bacterium]